MIKDILTLIRIKDWIKNIIIFLPLIFSGNLSNYNLQINLIIVFIIFSFSSTCIYILNDIVDLKDDQKHSLKRLTKPLAAKKLSVSFAKNLLVLFVFLLSFSIYFKLEIINYLLLYILINISYSVYLKKIPYLELFLICSGYLIRLEVGSFVTGVQTSLLLISSVFSLSFFVISIKRLTELIKQDTKRNKNLNYSNTILNFFIYLAGGTFLMSSLFFFILFNNYLLIIFPLLTFIIIRYFKSSLKFNLGEFPIELVVKDKKLLFSCFFLLVFTVYIYY